VNKKTTIGIVGVRGYVGRELVRLLAHSNQFKIDWVSSRQLEGQLISHLVDEDARFESTNLDEEHYFNQIKIENLSALEAANRDTKVIVLALPNGLAEPFVKQIEVSGKDRIIIDLSADYRFEGDWVYSVPELAVDGALLNDKSSKLIKISNPGCYATAMQLALAPIKDDIVGLAHCFGISGYSGAGTNPSPNNDPDNLRDNILPYGLVEHLHEKEVAFQLGISISFSPHVAEFFRGISMTVQMELGNPMTIVDVQTRYKSFYKEKNLVRVTNDVPYIQQVVNTDGCLVGGFTLSQDGKRLTVISCLDNLLKGAASQAIQNIEMALI